jgi:hypothetical protein
VRSGTGKEIFIRVIDYVNKKVCPYKLTYNENLYYKSLLPNFKVKKD